MTHGRPHSLAAYRLRRTEQLAHEAADSILELPDSALRRALCALKPETLLDVHAALRRASGGRTA